MRVLKTYRYLLVVTGSRRVRHRDVALCRLDSRWSCSWSGDGGPGRFAYAPSHSHRDRDRYRRRRLKGRRRRGRWRRLVCHCVRAWFSWLSATRAA